jgi:hypothetical protein
MQNRAPRGIAESHHHSWNRIWQFPEFHPEMTFSGWFLSRSPMSGRRKNVNHVMLHVTTRTYQVGALNSAVVCSVAMYRHILNIANLTGELSNLPRNERMPRSEIRARLDRSCNEYACIACNAWWPGHGIMKHFSLWQAFHFQSSVGLWRWKGRCRPGYIQTLPRISVVTKNNTQGILH